MPSIVTTGFKGSINRLGCDKLMSLIILIALLSKLKAKFLRPNQTKTHTMIICIEDEENKMSPGRWIKSRVFNQCLKSVIKQSTS